MKVKDFIMKLDGSDQEILNKLGACKSPDEAYDVAKSYGVDEPQEVFVAEMTKFYESIRELDESELEDVAGGLTDEDMAIATLALDAIATVATVAATAVTAVAATVLLPVTIAGVSATASGVGSAAFASIVGTAAAATAAS